MIRELMLRVFATTRGEIALTWMSVWHILYLVLIFGATALLVYRFRKHPLAKTEKRIRLIAYIIPTVYAADFFLMPFESENAGIQVIKLPFHICTLLAVLIPFAQFNTHLQKWRPAIATLSVTCSFLFLLYPGTAFGNYEPWCYLVIQTMTYHGLMLMWGVLSIASRSVTPTFSTLKRVAIVIAAVVLWASFGNAAYTHGKKIYDWFMVTGRSLPVELPPQIQPFVPYIMPIAVFAAVFGVSAVVIAVSRKAQTSTTD